jgi:DNA-binding CsgD family transcriptional regulator
MDPTRATAMLAEACLDCISSGEIRTALATARKAIRLADRADLGVRAFAASILANSLTLSGERVEAVALLDRTLPALRGADPLSDSGELITAAGQCYSWLERYDVATELLDRIITAARRASAPASLPWPLSCRAEVDVHTGRWAVAKAHAEEAVRLGQELGQSLIVPYGLSLLAWLAAAAGDERRCRDYAARALELVELHHVEAGRVYIDSTLGLLELALGHMAPAIKHLETVREVVDQHGLCEPSVVHWQPDLIEAYVRSGQIDAAEDALAAFDQQARATGGRWALGTAARCRGMLANGRQADRAFLESLEKLALAELPAPFEVARTRLCRGEHLRRTGMRTDARKALRAAIETFDRLGATAWATRAWTELRATGARARRRTDDTGRDELTPQELQVALIVAGGATNREAAAALFLSTKTIEFHLSRIYRKLGIRTRAQLAVLAAKRGWLESPPLAAVARQN